jgi:quercetin dioxygenase-like cupin family protein
MIHQTVRRRPLPFGLLAAAALIGTASAAMAGECPVDKRGVDVTQPVTTPAKDLTDTVLAAIDLATEPAEIKNRELRLRKLVVQPGGIVPWHNHADRSAIIDIIEGEITEYASTCAVPIGYKAGDVAMETHMTGRSVGRF